MLRAPVRLKASLTHTQNSLHESCMEEDAGKTMHIIVWLIPSDRETKLSDKSVHVKVRVTSLFTKKLSVPHLTRLHVWVCTVWEAVYNGDKC